MTNQPVQKRVGPCPNCGDTTDLVCDRCAKFGAHGNVCRHGYAEVLADRRRRRAAQKPGRCKKHPRRQARNFLVMRAKHRPVRTDLCIECAAVHVLVHGSTLVGGRP